MKKILCLWAGRRYESVLGYISKKQQKTEFIQQSVNQYLSEATS